MGIKILLDMPKPKSFDEELKEGASMECGLAGAMKLRDEFSLIRRTAYTTRDEGKDGYDRAD